MNRANLQQMAEDRILDAQTLLAGRRWSFAYYVAGYAVECALKSCILTQMVHTGRIFDENDNTKTYKIHDLVKLIDLAGLTAEFGRARSANPALNAHWKIVKGWTETSRYEQKTQIDAEDLLDAINDNEDGVFRWLQKHW